MKKIIKFSVILLLMGLFSISCEGVLDMDLLDDPNDITLNKADLDRYMHTIQIDFADFNHDMGNIGAELTRIDYMFGKTYINNFAPETLDNEWNTAYQGMFSDMKEAENLALQSESFNHVGVLKILKAYTLMTLVDFFGDVPFSEATQTEEFPFPNVDDDQTVYQAAIQLLDESLTYFQADVPSLQNDFYYNNDFDKWKKLANTLKMRAYVATRLVDADASSKFNSIVNSGNYISSSDDDFQFKYGTNITSPNTRHDTYDASYNTTGPVLGNYRSNWLMSEMLFDNDPRIRYYFYRQVSSTPGADAAPNQQQLPCSTQSKPSHYPADMIYCSVGQGYWGRDHGNDEGIPPDGFKRTLAGVYPAAGKFDDDDFSPGTLDDGGQGAGITPILLASWVDLMKAEMAMASNPVNGASFMEESIEKSISKVKSFLTLDPDADSSFAPSTNDIETFIANVVGDFNTANNEDKWDIFAKQYLIAHYGNGIDAYNFYRRTGYPTSLQYNIEPNPGNFIRTLLYPASEANTNSNIQQKPNGDIQVFWDNNPASPGFPEAQ